MRTDQEIFWAGNFGDEYVERNSLEKIVSNRIPLISKIISQTNGIESVLELGANVGRNLLAIRSIKPECRLNAVEINSRAVEQLRKLQINEVHEGSIFDFSIADLGRFDLTLTSGVLIHINPDLLGDVYERLYACSNKYICIIEYYSPTPVTIDYWGNQERLYKRDFAGELLDKYPDLILEAYGFQYHRDPNFPASDNTWFLLKKS
jgi:pseudaminic acid biosynthesis-associated methylase